MKIEEQATSLSLFGIFLSDGPIRMAAVLVSSFQLPQFNRKILFPPVAKEFGYVGVIGNPMGFARMLGSTSKISYQLLPRVFCRMAPGPASLLSNTVYAISDAAAQGNPMGFARNVRIDIKDFLSVTAKGILQEFGYAGVIGNPLGFARNVGIDIKDFLSVTVKGNLMGFARNVGLDIKDFLSVPAKGILQKLERRLFFAIHFEGAIKVLSYGAQHNRFELPSYECYEGYMFSWL
ncbi:hypothetical protein HHK36_000658 [Tetracentron sinense]|uniref:Uncharacterized protein n=1 Tax=Tetracentron sinense TaxID=13715 RepID=A0A834ZW95_TETSI|nr:hypothetical protein HHK36_000658 [Tetracentron sinense]